MKKYIFLPLIAMLLANTSCSDMEEVVINQGSVYYYQAAQTTNKFAMDGVSIAMKLAIFLEELEEQGVDFPEGETSLEADIYNSIGSFIYKCGNDEYNKMQLLFGNDNTEATNYSEYYHVSIYRDIDDKYIITYGGTEEDDTEGLFTSARYDKTYRNGSYVVDTKGVKLRESDADHKWSIKLDTDDTSGDYLSMLHAFTSDSYDAKVESYIYSMSLYYDSVEARFVYEGSTYMREYNTYDDNGLWVATGNLTIVGYDAATTALTLTNTQDKEYQLNIVTSKGVTLAGSSLTHYSTEPLILKIWESPHYYLGGVEVVYPTSNPSDIATITSYDTGTQKVTYNGTTETL